MRNGRRIAAVIVAAGKGLRMGGDVPKQYLIVNGKPVLWHTVRAFSRSEADDIIVVCPKGDEDYVKDVILADMSDRVSKIIPGGAERFDSCRLGVMAAKALQNVPDYILVHDGVRALVSLKVINSVIDALGTHDICCPGVIPKDTMRVVSEEGYAVSTPSRDSLRIIQTPQGFRTEDVVSAYELFQRDAETDTEFVHTVTDDAMLVAHYYKDKRIYLTEGSYENIKITTPEDLLLAEQILSKRTE